MKGKFKWLIGGVVVVGAGLIYSVTVIPSTSRVSTTGVSDEVTKKALDTLQDQGCLNCHSSHATLPFYGKLPGVSDEIKKDMTMGLRALDLYSMIQKVVDEGQVSEAVLAKLEKAVEDGTMPPEKFAMVHRASKIDSAEKESLLAWVKQTRLAQFATYGKDRKLVNEPIQPIVSQVKFDAQKAKLGFALYHDTRLSGDNTLSCAACHNLATGGVDNKNVSDGINGQKGGINAPTVFNAVFNLSQFWDGRAKDLQEQAGGPPLNPVEMGATSWDQIIAKLNADASFKATFTAVYPKGFTADSITDAIAEFERTLVTPDSPFDLYLKGDETAVSADVKEGYRLFKENRCATCHVGQAMGGQSYEYMGVVADYFADLGRKMTDADKGLFNVTHKEADLHKFKTPTLRNIALTAPYFHDASAKTLEDAVKVMLKYQVGKSLTDEEVAQIVTFLKAQNGKYSFNSLTR
jgi:cytochrome c peroxidase